ncbi:ADP-ribosyltransferase [Nocardia sp. CA-128927]|uniref:ADP-ribosyltransferase n=1 Tax=Nocardia sp. CA-128927 TaxID=3239975 RepID=UPI003D95C80E
MTGAVLDIDTAVYYDTATKLAAGAAAWWADVDARWPELEKANHMAGSYSDAIDWAKSYDARATEILKMVEKVATAAHAYAVVLNEMGYQRALGEHGATIDAGPAPVQPPAPMYPVLACRVPLPSAGGPGQGLVDEGLGLVEKIGLTVPDGNATTISNAALTWDGARNSAGAAGFPAILEAGAAAFGDVIAPEAAFIDEDLRALKAAAESTLTAMGELAQSCRDHRIALDELRELLKQQLEMVRDALIQELAITAAISVASSFITFGAGAAIGLAGAAAICARYARPMRVIIETWRTNRKISAGVRFDQDLARAKRECERLAPGGKLKPKPDPPVAPVKPTLSPADQAAIDDYANLGYGLNRGLREGSVTEAQQSRIDSITKALDNLPNHEGYVVRRTDLPPEVLARYQKGETIVEEAFTSTSTNVNRFSGPVEFQYISKTGKEISDYAPDIYKESEVLFRPNTAFQCSNRYTDPNTGRTIIQMREV